MINTNNSKNTNNEVTDTINNLLTSSKRDLLKKEFKTTIKPNVHNLLLDDTNLLKKTASFKKKKISNSYIQSKSFEEDEIAKNKLVETFSMFSNKQKKDLKEYLKDDSSASNSIKSSKSNTNSDSDSKNNKSKKLSSSEVKSNYSSEEDSEDDFEKDNRKLIKREKRKNL